MDKRSAVEVEIAGIAFPMPREVVGFHHVSLITFRAWVGRFVVLGDVVEGHRGLLDIQRLDAIWRMALSISPSTSSASGAM
jgi:hypothetical protein